MAMHDWLTVSVNQAEPGWFDLAGAECFDNAFQDPFRALLSR